MTKPKTTKPAPTLLVVDDLLGLRPALKPTERGVLLVAIAPPRASKRASKRKPPPLWYPGGWLVVTHDGHGTNNGWSIGPPTLANVTKHKFVRTDTFLLKGGPRKALSAVYDLYVDFLSDQEAGQRWEGALYLPKRNVVCMLG